MTWWLIVLAVIGVICVAFLFVLGLVGARAIWMSGEVLPVSFRERWGSPDAHNRICEGGDHFCNPCDCWRFPASDGDPAIACKLHLDDLNMRGF